jgi:hypothetical protein
VSLQTVAAHPDVQKGSTTKKKFGDNCVSSQTGAGKWKEPMRKSSHGINFTVAHGAVPTMSIRDQSLDATNTLVNDEAVVT